MKMTVTKMVDVDIDLDTLAKLFAHLDDDSQAQFFCKVAAAAAEDFVGGNIDLQWHYIGRHLRTCACSTEAGRDVIRSIYLSMEQPT
jgi:hypothetical protein